MFDKIYEDTYVNIPLTYSVNGTIITELTKTLITEPEDKILIFRFNNLNKNEFGQTEYSIQFNEITTIDILIIGGGGSGGKGSSSNVLNGCGGDAGGLIFLSNLEIEKGGYEIKVGEGGEGITTENSIGNNGKNSSFSYLETDAIGGIGGGYSNISVSEDIITDIKKYDGTILKSSYIQKFKNNIYLDLNILTIEDREYPLLKTFNSSNLILSNLEYGNGEYEIEYSSINTDNLINIFNLFGRNLVGELGIETNIDEYVNLFTHSYFKNNNINIVSITGHNAIFYISDDYKIYVSGNNGNGKLGLGHTANILTPMENTWFTDNNVKIIKIVAYNELVLFLDIEGKVYQTGLTSGYVTNKIPTIISFFETNNIILKDISVGHSHSHYLDINGNVYFYGWSYNGESGMGTTSYTYQPVLVTTFQNIKIKSIFSGNYFAMFIDEDDNIYSCGKNNYGQLGLNSTTDTSIATKINNLNGIKMVKVKLGYNFGLFLDSNGIIYGCGYNFNGQLGFGNYVTNNVLIKKIDWFIDNEIKIKDMDIGNSFSIFIDTNNNVYGCGFVPYKENPVWADNPWKNNLPLKITNASHVFCGTDQVYLLNDKLTKINPPYYLFNDEKIGIESAKWQINSYGTYESETNNGDYIEGTILNDSFDGVYKGNWIKIKFHQ